MLLSFMVDGNLAACHGGPLPAGTAGMGRSEGDLGRMMFDFADQRVVVTGAAGGVGRALVDVFKRLHAEVIAYDLDGAALAELDVGETATFDLHDRAALKAAVAATLKGKAAPAAVICNAGL